MVTLKSPSNVFARELDKIIEDKYLHLDDELVDLLLSISSSLGASATRRISSKIIQERLRQVIGVVERIVEFSKTYSYGDRSALRAFDKGLEHSRTDIIRYGMTSFEGRYNAFTSGLHRQPTPEELRGMVKMSFNIY